MNKKLTFNLIGNVLRIESALMLVPLAVSLLMGGDDAMAIFISLLITFAAGSALAFIRPSHDSLRAREGFAVVAFSWIFVSFFGGLPFYFSGYIPSLVDCFFETVSGFTTTGATILADVEILPKGLMFWRSFTHWAGGMGVLVLSLALIPRMGARSIHLMRAESPGPSVDKLVPRVSNNAKILYEIYVGLSILMVIALLLCGVNLYDALIHMFGAAGTGGFSNYAASVAHFDSAAVDIVIGVFMALFGVNFSLYYYIPVSYTHLAAKHIDRRRLGRIGQFCIGAAHQIRQFFIDNFDHLLARRQAVQNILSNRALRHLFDKILYDQKVDVRLQQCQTHIPHRGLNIGLAQLTLAGKFLKGSLQFIGQSLKCHAVHLSIRNIFSSACRALPMAGASSDEGCISDSASIHFSASSLKAR